MLASNKTLWKALERTDKKIKKKSKALPYIKTNKGKEKCRDAIALLESKKLKIKQQLQYNYEINKNV